MTSLLQQRIALLKSPRHLFKRIRSKMLEPIVTQEIERAASRRLDPSNTRLPDFLIIGAPKCGTSWLRVALAEHPEVIMAQEEIEFFPDPISARLDWYMKHFSKDSPFLDRRNTAYRKPYEDCIIGEKSARYCAMPEGRVKLVHRLMPDARLILMIRDPVKRHWAHAKQHFAKKKQAIEDLPRDIVFPFFERTRSLSEFSKMHDVWSRIYGPEKLLTLKQEVALAEPLETAKRTLSHLGIASDYDHDHTKKLHRQVNVGRSVPMPEDVRVFLEDLFADERQRLAELNLA